MCSVLVYSRLYCTVCSMYDVDGNGWIDLPEMTKIGTRFIYLYLRLNIQLLNKFISQIMYSYLSGLRIRFLEKPVLDPYPSFNVEQKKNFLTFFYLF